MNQSEQQTELVYALSGTQQSCTRAARQIAGLEGVAAANLVGSAQAF